MRRNLLYYIRIASSCQPIISATISAARGVVMMLTRQVHTAELLSSSVPSLRLPFLQGEIWLIWESSEMFWACHFHLCWTHPKVSTCLRKVGQCILRKTFFFGYSSSILSDCSPSYKAVLDLWHLVYYEAEVSSHLGT